MRGLFAALAAVAALALGASSATAVSPSQGPTVGGTSVLIESEAFRFIEISAGEGHTVGLTADGVVYAWGDNSVGQLGDGTLASSTVPTPVDTTGVLDGVTIVQVSAGYSHTVALADDGTIYAWGYGFYGQLGTGQFGGGASSQVPVAVDASGALAGRTITSIAAGYYSTTAIDSTGAVFTWGHGLYGQLGTGGTTHAGVPTAVDTTGVLSGVRIVQVAAGWDHMIAVSDDGRVFAWGSNGSGQLGTGGTGDSAVPVAVDTSGALSAVTVKQVALGSHHSLALGADGRVFAWGGNDRGQLGVSLPTGSQTPVDVSSMGALDGRTVVQVAGGWEHSVALADDGAVVAWGGNGFGQLGNGGSADSALPVIADAMGATPIRIGAGWEHTVAWAADGSAYAWGYNASGQAGDGTTDDASRPVATVMPELEVLFGGVPAASVMRVDTDTVRAVTPAHPSGTVDIEVRQGGNARYALITDRLEGAYTFGAAPTIVDHPASAQVASGETVSLRASADADEAAVAQWQSKDAVTGTWSDITGGTDLTTDLRTVSTIVVTAPDAGRAEYRVVFTNPLGVATTEMAVLTVAVPGAPDSLAEKPSTAGPDATTDLNAPATGPDATATTPATALAATGAGLPGLGIVGLIGVAALSIGFGLVVRRTRTAGRP